MGNKKSYPANNTECQVAVTHGNADDSWTTCLRDTRGLVNCRGARPVKGSRVKGPSPGTKAHEVVPSLSSHSPSLHTVWRAERGWASGCQISLPTRCFCASDSASASPSLPHQVTAVQSWMWPHPLLKGSVPRRLVDQTRRTKLKAL